MILLPWRQHVLVFLLCITCALTEELPPNCEFNFGGVHYDLKLMNGEWTIGQDRPTPPTTMHDELRFNVCDNLKKLEGVSDGDQCAQGTRACFRTINEKPGETSRVVSTIPVAQSSTKFTIDRLPSDRGKGIVLTMSAGSYPSDGGKPQSFKLSLICVDKTEGPQFIGYDGSQVSAEWKAIEACGASKDPSSGDADPGGSSMGWFFFILLVIIVAYFALGAYHNYNQYGAAGWDLIPHRDFWRDVPYLIRDLVSHLFTSGRSGRGGYTSV
ncbi:autophagy-related protein 27 [Rhizoctonia solani]|nr:autophagy-related protein 27 [Rhizoctonia solani]